MPPLPAADRDLKVGNRSVFPAFLGRLVFIFRSRLYWGRMSLSLSLSSIIWFTASNTMTIIEVADKAKLVIRIPIHLSYLCFRGAQMGFHKPHCMSKVRACAHVSAVHVCAWMWGCVVLTSTCPTHSSKLMPLSEILITPSVVAAPSP